MKTRHTFSAKDANLNPNVEGVVLGTSIHTPAYHVKWVDEGGTERTKWVSLEQLDPEWIETGTNDEPLQTPTWQELRGLITEHSLHMQDTWSDMKKLYSELKDEAEQNLDERDVAQALSFLDLPEVNQLGTDEYASQLTIQLLDHGFEQSLRSRFPSLAPTQQDAQHGFTHEDGETLMRYLVCQFGRLEDWKI